MIEKNNLEKVKKYEKFVCARREPSPPSLPLVNIWKFKNSFFIGFP